MLCAAGLSLSLGLGVMPQAYAASSSTNTELEQLTNEVNKATSIFAKATEKSAGLQAQVDSLADEIIALEQDVLPEKRQAASDAAVTLYKQQCDGGNLLSMLFSANSLSDLIELNKYLATIQSSNVRALEDFNKIHDELQEKLSSLSAAKDEALSQQRVADEALATAKEAHAKIEQKASSEDKQEAEAARKAAQAAEEARQQIEQAEQQAQPAPETGSQPQPQPETEAEPQPDKPGGGEDAGNGTQGSTGTVPDQGADSDKPADQGGWLSGVASYYGIGDGFMGGTTASGEIVTETSMGIAMLNVPFGTRVEIRYGGRSVIAYVNDRGPYVHGRVIDMQPAVARALNFIDVGVGTVEYRFL